MPKLHPTPPLPQQADDGSLLDANREGMREAWEKFASLLKASGNHITTARHIVFTRVCELAAHFRADDLAAELAHGPNRVSRGTVYRTLAILVEGGLLREVRDSHRHVHYERTFGCPRHEHMICDKCGRFVEFTDTKTDAHVEDLCKANGFTNRMFRLVIFGVCDRCRSSPDVLDAATKGNNR